MWPGKQMEIELRNGRTIKIDYVDGKQTIDAAFVFPRYSSMKEREIKEVQANGMVLDYVLDQTKKASFADALAAIEKSSELKALGVKQMTTAIVEIIAGDPDHFTATDVCGFVFQVTGQAYLFLRNKTLADSLTESALDRSRVAFMDVTEVRRLALHQYQQQDKGALMSPRKFLVYTLSGASALLLAVVAKQALQRLDLF
jgi:hypothetical protein